MVEKENCFKCRWRGSVPGSAHTSCKHPDLKEVNKDPFGGMMAMFASVGRGAPIVDISAFSKKFEIRANSHGIAKGWFNWPYDFDPVWLENCNAFEIRS
jgi:hypothetical protein